MRTGCAAVGCLEMVRTIPPASRRDPRKNSGRDFGTPRNVPTPLLDAAAKLHQMRGLQRGRASVTTSLLHDAHTFPNSEHRRGVAKDIAGLHPDLVSVEVLDRTALSGNSGHGPLQSLDVLDRSVDHVARAPSSIMQIGWLAKSRQVSGLQTVAGRIGEVRTLALSR
jgi:hypothetical protein